jgi:hypothetical protein
MGWLSGFSIDTADREKNLCINVVSTSFQHNQSTWKMDLILQKGFPFLSPSFYPDFTLNWL